MRPPVPVGNTGYTPVMAKVMVSLPDELLRSLDAEAERRGTTRSGLLRDYVQEGIRKRSRERARKMQEIFAESSDHGGRNVELLRQERRRRLER